MVTGGKRFTSGSRRVAGSSPRVEVGYEPQLWPAERLLRKMLAYSDIMPGDFYRETVEQYDLEQSRKQTCGSVARALLEQRRDRQTV